MKRIAASLVLAVLCSPASGLALAACTKIYRPLVIQIDFPGIPRAVDSNRVKQKFLDEPDRYIREMSHGKACLSGELTKKWYRMPETMPRYFVPWQNLKVDKNNLIRLVADSVGQAERDYDITKYDFVVIVLAANAKQWGNQGLNTYPGLLGWKDESALMTPAGSKINGGIAVFAHTANVTKIVHNMAHIIGGVRNGRRVLPDMYDQDLQSATDVPVGQRALSAYVRSQIHMGAWDPMSCNQCLQRPGPPGFTSWTRLRLGWLEQDKVRNIKPGESVELSLGALGDPAAETKAIRIMLKPPMYYLIENRQPIGLDKNLPSSGILVMQGNLSIPEPRFGRAPVRLINADPSKPNLDAAAFDIGRNAVFEDKENGIKIELLRKKGTSYDIRVTRD